MIIKHTQPILKIPLKRLQNINHIIWDWHGIYHTISIETIRNAIQIAKDKKEKICEFTWSQTEEELTK